ncbi:hypothetical protein CYLTODRAFT_345511 [Cylindrobasidium torrendii FP15055 ss-10]|uniref:DNA mismatch repair protein MSH3 n=1 Tax=Cylindrobasidium torrendii FP15055 ss-10 TaxID=1314674 RepID=A0A0D7BN23_9AGAR|nr:hypothetical protein CYLTODRAFT_345511 [Cylindrobasidium torrendii FP15055 ss-10]
MDLVKGKAKRSAKKKEEEQVGPSGQTYTPLENQVLALKEAHKDTLLMIKVGYKYKFFGQDALVAAKELGMYAYEDRNFTAASIPDHRRDIHLKKLLARGYKVGIVEQAETAALKKAGDNRNTVFERKLDKLYTAATYVDDLDSLDETDKYVSPPFLCVVETENANRVTIGMLSVAPSTGDIVWDEFQDDQMRLEFETRLSYTKPAEILVCKTNITKQTDKILTHYTKLASDVRIEPFEAVMSYSDAFSYLCDFYTKQQNAESARAERLLAEVSGLPKQVIVALAHTVSHLAAFGLSNVFADARFFTKFSTQTHMLLTTNTLNNLEIYQNQTDYSSKGTLMSILDQTKTNFGARMLKTWVGRPLTNRQVLQERIDAVEEILESASEKLAHLRQVLKGMPDLAKGLSRIQFTQCTPRELASILAAFKRVGDAVEAVDCADDVGFKSGLLNEIIYTMQGARAPVDELLKITTLKRLASDDKESLWLDQDRYPDLRDHTLALMQLEDEFEDELKSIRKTLRYPSLSWSSIAGDDYLIEVKKADNRPIPDDYILVSRTKFFERYQTPAVRHKIEERSQRQECIASEANKAFKAFLGMIHETHYAVLRDVVTKLATADCLLSLAHVALQPNYVKPTIAADAEGNVLDIVEGRHPIVEALSSDPFVPNSVSMGGQDGRVKIITGPNMGGKSSVVRMVALIAIMAQIGSYVPATGVRMGLLDSVLTRMGASDDILRGRSTFMVEMAETSDILRLATKNSLVILDELGRGTSTFDGMAIAHATLQHLNDATRCKTLFITHYPSIALDLEKRYPQDVQNFHMNYATDTRVTGAKDVTFLYNLVQGLASESFGVECGRLAGLPESILERATVLSCRMREEVVGRMRKNRMRTAAKMVYRLRDDPEELRTYLKGLGDGTMQM